MNSLLEILARPESPWSEHIRGLAGYLRRTHAGRSTLLLLTSSWEGEGKSTVAANLAVALGQFGARVLLVDGDLRRPTLSTLFEQTAAGAVPGLIQALRAEPVSASRWETAGVDFLPAGRCSPQEAAELLALGPWLELIRSWREQYELVLVDSPPLSICSDALVLGSRCDGAYLVVKAQRFQGAPEGNYCEDLRDHGIPILGAILNATEEARAAKRSTPESGWRLRWPGRRARLV